MVVALWILVGLGVGWAGGRLLAVKRGGSAGDVAAGVLGSLSAAGAMQAMNTAAEMPLEILLAGVAGALAATFAWRAFADRYQGPLA